VVVPNRAPFRQKSPGDCTQPLLNQYQAWRSLHLRGTPVNCRPCSSDRRRRLPGLSNAHSQKASRVYRPWTDGTEDPQPCHALRFLFWAYPARDACRWAAMLERPTSPATGVPLSTPSTVRGLLPLSVTDSRCGDRTRAPPCRHPPPRISRWYGLTPVDTEYRASAGYCLARPRSLTVSPRASVEGARRVLQRRKSCAAEALSRRGAR
jgi:hypothetical protein